MKMVSNVRLHHDISNLICHHSWPPPIHPQKSRWSARHEGAVVDGETPGMKGERTAARQNRPQQGAARSSRSGSIGPRSTTGSTRRPSSAWPRRTTTLTTPRACGRRCFFGHGENFSRGNRRGRLRAPGQDRQAVRDVARALWHWRRVCRMRCGHSAEPRWSIAAIVSRRRSAISTPIHGRIRPGATRRCARVTVWSRPATIGAWRTRTARSKARTAI